MHSKPNKLRIVPLAGIIITVIILLAGASVFVVMERYATTLLNNRLQLSLESRVKLTKTEIEIASERTAFIATRPLLIDLLQLANADDTAAQSKLNMSARSFVENGHTAIAFYGEDGQELARFGVFAQQSELAVPLAVRCDGNGRIQSGPLSGPLLIAGHLVTLYFCLIVFRVRPWGLI